MNLKVSTAKFLLAVSIFAFGHSAFAQQGVDPRTRDLLIEKLTQVYLNLAPADTAKTAITLRLADLHSERARLDAMKDLDSGCTVCEAGKADRQKALGYYRDALSKVADNQKGKILAQLGHLQELTGNEKEAVATYEKILKTADSPADAISEANLSLAEIYFKRRDYAHAIQFYSSVVSSPSGAMRGLAAYRIAWSNFNTGHTDQAIADLKKILTAPDLQSKSGSASGVAQIDHQFLEEASHDLSTFMVRNDVSLNDAKTLFDLSPESVKVANVSYLASECERLGRVSSSIDIWRFVIDKQAKPSARLEGYVHLAQLEMEHKEQAAASKDFDAAISLWAQMEQTSKCDNQDCVELHARMRKFVTDWNRAEKKQPSEQLLAAYKTYLNAFPTEADMNLWGGAVAQETKQYPLAVTLDLKAAQLASTGQGTVGSDSATQQPNEIATAGTKKSSAAKTVGGVSRNDVIEAGLLQAIEAAELSKDNKLLTSAYDSYLALSKERKKTLEVQYQKAHLVYDAGDYATAADTLREVALSKTPGSADVKSQAAQLSLDSLVLMKDDAKLEAWSADYAKAFPKEADEFRGISRKSVLTQATAEATKGDQDSLNKAWATLARFDISTATPADKVAYFKNRLVLAEKLGKVAEARDAADNMLRLPALTATDQQFALSRKAWLAEMVLDFDTALLTTQKLKDDKLPKDQKALKLAMYAELASKDPKPYYAEFLKTSKDDDKNVAITTQLVRDSKDPLKEIEKNKAVLSKKPEVLADLYMEAFARNGDMNLARRVTANKDLAATAAGKALTRSMTLDDYAKLQKKMAAHQIDSSSQSKLAKSLKARVALLDESEKLATKAVESGDWTSELVTLNLLGKQSERFYQEVLALPVPDGLSDEEQTQYMQLLSQQAAPHQLKANDVAKKISEFWDNKDAMAQLTAAAAKETGARRTMVMKEIEALDQVAPEAKKAELDQMLASKEPAKEVPTLASIEGARQAVRENPLDRTKIEALLSLEKKTAHSDTMVAYLEGRLATLETPVPATKGVEQ